MAVHVAEAMSTISAIRTKPPRARRTEEYARGLERLETDLLSITSRLMNHPPQDEDIETDLRAAVNMVRDLNHVELEPVRKDVEAAFLAFIGKA